MKLEVIRRCSGVFPHAFSGPVLWASRGNAVCTSTDLGVTWRRRASVHSGAAAWVAGVRAVDRFVHVSPFVLVPLVDGGALAWSRGGLRRLWPGEHTFRPLDSPITFRPMRRGICTLSNGDVLVGEYRDNGGEVPRQPRKPVTIWRLRDGLWSEAWVFPAGSVRHVHALVPDPRVTGRVYVLTGDTDSEAAIWRTDDNFGSLAPYYAKGQHSRACDLLFSGDDLVWGIDSPLQTSGVLRAGVDRTQAAWLCTTQGPVYYGGQNEAGHMWFGTSVETGPSVTTRKVQVVASRDGWAFSEAFSRSADRLPQLSQVHIPAGTAPGDAVVFSLRATWRWENSMVVGRLVDDARPRKSP